MDHCYWHVTHLATLTTLTNWSSLNTQITRVQSSTYAIPIFFIDLMGSVACWLLYQRFGKKKYFLCVIKKSAKPNAGGIDGRSGRKEEESDKDRKQPEGVCR